MLVIWSEAILSIVNLASIYNFLTLYGHYSLLQTECVYLMNLFSFCLWMPFPLQLVDIYMVRLIFCNITVLTVALVTVAFLCWTFLQGNFYFAFLEGVSSVSTSYQWGLKLRLGFPTWQASGCEKERGKKEMLVMEVV